MVLPLKANRILPKDFWKYSECKDLFHTCRQNSTNYQSDYTIANCTKSSPFTVRIGWQAWKDIHIETSSDFCYSFGTKFYEKKDHKRIILLSAMELSDTLKHNHIWIANDGFVNCIPIMR